MIFEYPQAPILSLEGPIATWTDLLPFAKSYEQIWERGGLWLMGREILPKIIDFWRQNLPIPVHPECLEDGKVSLKFQFPTVLDELSGEPVLITQFVPLDLAFHFESCLGEIGKLRWRSWKPGFEAMRYRILNQHSFDHIKMIIGATEERAKSEGLPELWQIGASVFGLSTVTGRVSTRP